MDSILQMQGDNKEAESQLYAADALETKEWPVADNCKASGVGNEENVPPLETFQLSAANGNFTNGQCGVKKRRLTATTHKTTSSMDTLIANQLMDANIIGFGAPQYPTALGLGGMDALSGKQPPDAQCASRGNSRSVALESQQSFAFNFDNDLSLFSRSLMCPQPNISMPNNAAMSPLPTAAEMSSPIVANLGISPPNNASLAPIFGSQPPMHCPPPMLPPTMPFLPMMAQSMPFMGMMPPPPMFLERESSTSQGSVETGAGLLDVDAAINGVVDDCGDGKCEGSDQKLAHSLPTGVCAPMVVPPPSIGYFPRVNVMTPVNISEEDSYRTPFTRTYVNHKAQEEFRVNDPMLFTQYCNARNCLYVQYRGNAQASCNLCLPFDEKRRYTLQFLVDAKIQERKYFNHFYALYKGKQQTAEDRAANEEKVPECGKKRTKKPKFADENVRVFGDWFNSHNDNPYPSKADKEGMADLTGLTRYQVSRWFCNARTRRHEHEDFSDDEIAEFLDGPIPGSNLHFGQRQRSHMPMPPPPPMYLP